MTAHCIDACNLQYSARAKRYTKLLVKQALASQTAISAEQRRQHEAALRAARRRAIEGVPSDEDDFDE